MAATEINKINPVLTRFLLLFISKIRVKSAPKRGSFDGNAYFHRIFMCSKLIPVKTMILAPCSVISPAGYI